tara:strand:- start:1085 stop:1291 length:207 start_codon:yes stop_codon:yes gene_type:complete
MNEDNLNMEIRKFLKKVGITSQRLIEKDVCNAYNTGKISLGSKLDIEMNLKIKSLNSEHQINGNLNIE